MGLIAFIVTLITLASVYVPVMAQDSNAEAIFFNENITSAVDFAAAQIDQSECSDSNGINFMPMSDFFSISLTNASPVQKFADYCTEHLGKRANAISDFSYSEVYTMEATAYTAGPESTGKRPGMPGYGITASGMHVQPGVIAVDPRLIPLGTHVYVKGYGYSIAADTGGAIKGRRIDVYMETLSQAYQWGRRSVKVYILD